MSLPTGPERDLGPAAPQVKSELEIALVEKEWRVKTGREYGKIASKVKAPLKCGSLIGLSG